ncbi:ankyrin repeat-containing domain protein [Diplogelasinospora grovesii]|uniref:Ankyrin repeat-containing domain protein n=1 Tax=Diplogelasinospora grovesii TaxID=303347 RepID=A0AAN6S0A7_9PEZI|nr:ankyrin repeat-containing domain protein [Diplogelasinospora grovesii]
MASSGLYLEGLAQFRKTAQDLYRDAKDQELLGEFLRERTTPEETKSAAESLQSDASKKYGSRKIGDTVIPETWIANIMDNIQNFVAAGNYAMTAAPESVGLAWFAVKLTLSAIQNNYDLYTFFGTGLTDISEIMIIIPHYDRLYDERSSKGTGWKPSPIVEKLFKDLIATYAAVLDFSFSVKRHLTPGTLARLRHGFKDFFGLNKGKFEAKLSTIAELKRKILEESQAAFQDKALHQFEGVQGVVEAIESTVGKIRQFQSTLDRWHNEQTAQLASIQRSLEDLKTMTKPKTPWDFALQEFDKNREALKPLKETSEALEVALNKRFPGTCEWVFKDFRYTDWEKMQQNNLLCVTGQEGSGKSTVLASVVEHLGTGVSAESTVLLYFSCSTDDAGTNINTKLDYNADRICNTLLYQLYYLAAKGGSRGGGVEHDVSLLKACNEVFANPKSKKVSSILSKSSRDEDLPDFGDAFERIAVLLQKSVVIVLDGVDDLSDKDQDELSSKLQGLLDTPSPASTAPASHLATWIKVLLGCRLGRFGTNLYNLAVSTGFTTYTYIDVGAMNREDMDLVLTAALKTVSGLSLVEQEEAKTAMLEKAGPRFSYVTEIAIPFMREPFQRPLSRRLEALPDGMNEAYSEALRRMSPNYVDLLRMALTWTILAPVPPRAEEVMDAFQGVYNVAPPAAASGSDGDAGKEPREEPEGFSKPSRLEIDQLGDASGPFLLLYQDGGPDNHYLYLQDPVEVERFCVGSGEKDATAEEKHCGEQLCARCKSALPTSTTISVTHKEGHLQMALTCLRHLNNPLFQKRAGLVRKGDASQAASKAELKSEPDMMTLQENRRPEVDEHQDDRSESKRGESEEPNQVAEKETDQSAKESSTLAAEGETTGNQDQDSGYDSDGSEDDEDRGPIDLSNDGKIEALWRRPETETDGSGEEDDDDILLSDGMDRRPRYEIQYWPYHIRQAEEHHWTSREERAQSETWKAVMIELDKLAFSTPKIFAAWQAAYRDTNSFLSDIKATREPLHVAAYLGLVSWAEYLIVEHNKDPNELSDEYNALQAAASKADRPDMLRLLLEKGGDVNAENKHPSSAFYLWLWKDAGADRVRMMLDHGANPMIVDKLMSWTALHYFAWQGDDPEVLKLLLAYPQKPDINTKTEGGSTPLHVLLWRRDVPQDLLQAFIDNGADVNAEDFQSARPLQMASAWGELETLKILVARGVEDIDDPDNDGDTALHQAASRGYTECVRYLAENGAKVDVPNKRGRTALHHAAERGFTNCVQNLLDLGADPNHVDNHNRTPLFWASHGQSQDTASIILDELLERRLLVSEINKATKYGRTPLRQAAARGFDEIVQKILGVARLNSEGLNDGGNCLDVNAQDTKKGMTALHRAAWNGHVQCVKLLLDAHADVKIQDLQSRTALKLAYERWALASQQSSFEEIISLLMKQDPTATANDGELLAICAVNGSTRLLKELRRHGADLNRRDQYGWTPLELARKSGQDEAAKFLEQQSAWTRMLPGRWLNNPQQKGKGSVCDDGVTIAHTSDWICISSDKPLPPGLDKYYFEVTFPPRDEASQYLPERYPTVGIGFCTLGGVAIQFPGWPARPDAPSAKSWGYHGDDGLVMSSRGEKHRAPNEAERYGPGDTVGAGVDLGTRQIWFTKNGRKLDRTFDNIHGRLFPLLGLGLVSGMVKLTTNFTGPFHWVGAKEEQLDAQQDTDKDVTEDKEKDGTEVQEAAKEDENGGDADKMNSKMSMVQVAVITAEGIEEGMQKVEIR